MTVVSAKSFPDGASLPLVADIQYREPYSSAAFNRKLRGILGMGLYKGLYPMPGSGLNLLISSQDSGDTSGTASFDIGDDYQITVRQQADITIAMTAGTSKIVALQCVFGLGIETYQVNSDATIQAAEIVLLDAGTTLGSNQLELGVVTIPADATQITTDMIDVSGRILQTIGIELSSAIDSTSETVAANSYAIKRALDYVAGKFALLGSNADITSMSALTSISGSALSIAGALTLSSTLSVAGATAFSSDVTTGGNLTATGATTLISTLDVTGATRLASSLAVTGTTTLTNALIGKSTLALTGAAALSSTLMVGGTATFSSDVAVFGTLTGITQSVGTSNTSMATTGFVTSAIGTLKGLQRFIASGSFTVPTGVTTVYLSGAAGGGGGGGGAGGYSNSTAAGGGGGSGGNGGEAVYRYPVTVTPGATYTITIGAGGTAGTYGAVDANGGSGGSGGNTTFGSLLTLTGGGGGVGGYSVGNAAAGGRAASAGGARGSDGHDGSVSFSYGGSGGAGGSGPFGGGGGGGRAGKNAGSTGTGGYPGNGYGSGGGGAGGGYGNTAALGYIGGAGASGIMVVEW